MIQTRDDKKEDFQPFKMKQVMIDLDEYLMIFILPQIPAEFKDYRESLRRTMDKAWRAMYHAAFTAKRERQRQLVLMKIEMAMVEVYLQEVREICYRGKEKRRLDKMSARRFEVCAKKHREVMDVLWGWITNEDKKLNTAKSEKTVGLVEREEI